MHTHTRMHAHIHTHARTHTHACTHTYTHTFTWPGINVVLYNRRITEQPTSHQAVQKLIQFQLLKIVKQMILTKMKTDLVIYEYLQEYSKLKCFHCRGDYKTGKRLNMRRIIPYIASHYQNDRIWLCRSKPSKMHYQLIIAMDDSSSMQDNKCKQV